MHLEFTCQSEKVDERNPVASDALDSGQAYTLVSDSNSKGGVEFSFLENTGWAVSLEDVIINLETQSPICKQGKRSRVSCKTPVPRKADLGQPFRRHRFPMPAPEASEMLRARTLQSNCSNSTA